MKIELTEAEARLIKTLLRDELENEELEEERLYELQAYLGDDKGEEMHEKIYSLLKDTLSKFEKYSAIDTSNGYDMGLAQIVDNNIFEQIIEDKEEE